MHRLPNHLQEPKDHDHYGPETQEALSIFQEMWTSYFNTTWINFKENTHRLDAIQSAWDNLAKARKAETGTGFYLTKEEYEDGNAG